MMVNVVQWSNITVNSHILEYTIDWAQLSWVNVARTNEVKCSLRNGIRILKSLICDTDQSFSEQQLVQGDVFLAESR